MKFSIAWAATAAQNVTLKAAVAVLGTSALVLALTCVKLALKPPLVVDRECRSEAAKLVSGSDHTAQEIETFVRAAITARFNSDAQLIPGYLAAEEETSRLAEQKELSNRGITQKVIITSVKVAGDTAAIDADRLISVGSIRSAFPFPLTAILSSITRTEINPYGLVLSKISPPKVEGSK